MTMGNVTENNQHYPIFDNSNSALLSVDDLASVLQVKTATIRDWVYRKAIPYIKVGRLVRFRWSAIEKWLSERSHDVD